MNEFEKTISRMAVGLRRLFYLSEAPSHLTDKPHIGKGKQESTPPPRVHSTYDKYLRYANDLNDRMEYEIESITKGKKRRENESNEDWKNRILEEHEGKSALAVSLREGGSVDYIRQLRLTNGRNPDNGAKTVQASPTA